ncbi:MAG: DUF6145 family protein [Lachnospiraceae bacterium]|nr:DUF6145 family protein [Lachnospiraceae bacterium]
MEDQIVLCVANSYEKKFYLNPEFGQLPEAVKDELKSMSVLFTEENGGIFEVLFDEDGELMLRTDAEEGDLSFDEIGAGLLVKRLRSEKRELFEKLTLFYKVVFLGETFD